MKKSIIILIGFILTSLIIISLRWILLPKVIRNELTLTGLGNRYYSSSQPVTDTTFYRAYHYQGFFMPTKVLDKASTDNLLKRVSDKTISNGDKIYIVNKSEELINLTFL